MEEEELKASCLEGHGQSQSGIGRDTVSEACLALFYRWGISSPKSFTVSFFRPASPCVRLDPDLSTWRSHANSKCNILQHIKPEHVIFPKTFPLLGTWESSLFLHDTYSQTSSLVTQTCNTPLEAVVCSDMLPLALLKASSTPLLLISAASGSEHFLHITAGVIHLERKWEQVRLFLKIAVFSQGHWVSLFMAQQTPPPTPPCAFRPSPDPCGCWLSLLCISALFGAFGCYSQNEFWVSILR